MPSLAARKDFQQLLQRITGETITIRPDSNVTEFQGFAIRVADKEIRPQMYRNPFDIPRKELIDQVVRMRANFLQVAMSKSARFMNEGKHDKGTLTFHFNIYLYCVLFPTFI